MFMRKENVTKLFRKKPKTCNAVPTQIVVNYNSNDNTDYHNKNGDNSGASSLKLSTHTQRIVSKSEDTGDIYYLLQLHNANNFVHYDIFNQYQTLIFNILEMPRGNKALIYHFAL